MEIAQEYNTALKWLKQNKVGTVWLTDVTASDEIKQLAEALPGASNLIELRIEDSLLENADLVVLANGLKAHSNLLKLDLSKNPDITNEGLTTLVEALAHNPNIERLVLNEFPGINTNMPLFASWLAKNTSLRELELMTSNLTPENTIHLAKSLEQNHSLPKLYLSANEDIMDEEAEILANMLKVNTGLQSLILNGCGITCIGASYFAQVLEKENFTLLHLALRGIVRNENAEESLVTDPYGKIDLYLERNQRLLQAVQQAACEVLKAGRWLLHSQWLDTQQLSWVDLPKELKEAMIAKVDSLSLLSDKQMSSILAYAYNKGTLIGTKEMFFHQTGCDRFRLLRRPLPAAVLNSTLDKEGSPTDPNSGENAPAPKRPKLL